MADSSGGPIIVLPQPLFAQEVERRLKDGYFRGMLNLGRTPAVLRMLGFPDVPLRLSGHVLNKIATGKDGNRAVLTPLQISRLPEYIDEAIGVFDSATVPSAFVVLINAKNADGDIVVTVEPNKLDGNAQVNVVTSAYGKAHISWMERQASEGRLLYLEKNKGFDTLEVCSLTLNCETEPGSRNPQAKTILGPVDLCNFRAEQRARRA